MTTDNFWNEKTKHWAQFSPNKIALRDEGQSLSFVEIESMSAQLAERFEKNDLRPGDRVLVVLPRNCAQALILISLLRSALVGLMVDPKTSIPELRALIRQVDPRAVIAPSDLMNRLGGSETFARTEDLGFQKSFQRPTLFVDPTVKLSAPHAARSATSTGAQLLTSPGTEWLLMTSGSTGRPKIVMLSAENLRERSEGEVRDFQLNSEHRLLNALPFSHDLGLNQLLCLLVSGCFLFIKSSFTTRLDRSLVSQTISGMTGTPLLWKDFAKTLRPDQIFPELQFITISGGLLSTARREWLRSVFPRARIIRTYGQSETFRTLITDRDDEPGAGHPLTGTQVRLLNRQDEPCQPGESGELIHFGAGVMSGYLFDEEASRAQFFEDAEYGRGVRSGDLFVKNETFEFLGRADDLTKRFEQRFQLSEVEDYIRGLDGVAEAVALLRPTPEGDWRQQELRILVTLNPSARIEASEILRSCQRDLSYYKIPDRVVVLADLPRTPSYKIDRRLLSQQWELRE